MRQLKFLILALGTVTVTASLLLSTAFAEKIDLGKQSRERIREACSEVGGEQLSDSESGSYGCEVPEKGTMILCNKHNDCTGYTPARTKAARQRVLDSLELDAIAEPDDFEVADVPEERELEARSE